MKMHKMIGTNCLLYSAAMVLDVDASILVKEIGHDGSHIVWPHLGSPLGEVNYHIQEIMDCFIKRGYALAPIDLYPITEPIVLQPVEHYVLWKECDAEDRFIEYIKGHEGILIGQGNNGLGHAAAWDGELVYDPNGVTYELSDFAIAQAWIKVKWI